MKKITLLSLAILLQLATTKAQVAKKMMVEHFTNTQCGICANRNPGFHNNLIANPQVQSISIHPSSPYPSCFLSQQNTTHNDARTNYYNIFGGTPRIMINGSLISSSQNYADAAMFTPFIAQSSFTIVIQQFAVGADSIRSEITVKRIATGTLTGTAKLFAGLVEDTVFGNGGNGEMMHFNVLRRALFTPQGQTITLPVNVGDSLLLIKTENFNPIWNAGRMRTVAILQEEISKQLIQSELSSTAQIGITTLTSASKQLNEIKVFPNPVSNYLNVCIHNNAIFNYTLSNQYGQLLQNNTITNSEKIDVSVLPNGIYFVKLSNEQMLETYKIVVFH